MATARLTQLPEQVEVDIESVLEGLTELEARRIAIESAVESDPVEDLTETEARRMVEEATSLPTQFKIGRLRDGRLRITAPIEVIRRIEGGECVVEAPEINEFGFGTTLSAAIIDLQRAIAELYLTLEEEEHRLGSDLKSTWDMLRRKIRKADAAISS